ncbi:MAG: hypothetical protein QF464_08815, partial [Myxococcota bacterium]|nr:hypothetical protein [Myxococcota bacterium]
QRHRGGGAVRGQGLQQRVGALVLRVHQEEQREKPPRLVLLFGGLSPGAAIAFLLTGPATNVVTFGLLTSLHSRRVAVVFGLTMAIMACGLGWLANLWSPGLTGVAGHGLDHAHGVSTVQLVSLAALAGLTLFSLVRKGPRELLAKVVPQHQHVHLDGEPCPEQPASACCPGEAPPPPASCCPEDPPPVETGCCD